MEFSFENIHNPKKLELLLDKFLKFTKRRDLEVYNYLCTNLETYKGQPFTEKYDEQDINFIHSAVMVEHFLLEFMPKEFTDAYFDLKKELRNKSKGFTLRKKFINKYVKTFPVQDLKNINFSKLEAELFSALNITSFDQTVLADVVLTHLRNRREYQKEFYLATKYCAYIWHNLHDFPQYAKLDIFFKAEKTDFSHLIDTLTSPKGAKYKNPVLFRDNFNYYNFLSAKVSLHNNNYCVKCHLRSRDSCKVGDLNPNFISLEANYKTNQEIAEPYKKNPLEQPLEGCPLGMHISQMHMVAEDYYLIAALVLITINNPLVAGTGYSICNDCKVSCIFQKQSAVDTPLSETKILQTILDLPWGFELYNLLTLWNPVRFYRPTPVNKYQGYNILVVGSGPAGYSLAYNLLQEGYGVFITENLPIKPITTEATLIKNIKDYYTNLEETPVSGFGGVAAYGITSRWNKNFLTIIRIILSRYNRLTIKGSTFFGSALNFNNAHSLGFHHIALCCGTGKPNILPNLTGKGIRNSSEFLMALELGAYQKESLFNLQIRLPLVVIGAGLTAIDCATEAIVYYKRQLSKFLKIYNELLVEKGQEALHRQFSKEDLEILQEYQEHYQILQNSKDKKAQIRALQKLGGVKILYNKSLEESSAYKNNYQELENALNQGVIFCENTEVIEPIFNKHNHVIGLNVKKDGQNLIIEAKTVITALGTNYNNTILNNEFNFNLQYKPIEPNYNYSFIYKNKLASVYLGKNKANNLDITYFGDMNKHFKGSVVKAMASAFYGFSTIKKIVNSLNEKCLNYNKWQEKLLSQLAVKVSLGKKIAPNLQEIIITSPLLSSLFQPGNFFKIQNQVVPYLEPLIITGVSSNSKKHTITAYLKDLGLTSHIVVNNHNTLNYTVNGPLGYPTFIPQNKNVLLLGENIYNNSPIALLQALKENNNNITYLANFYTADQIFGLDLINKYATSCLICLSEETELPKNKSNNIKYSQEDFLDILNKNNSFVDWENINYIYISATAASSLEIQKALNAKKLQCEPIINIHSLMNCSGKGICGTCIQKHKLNNEDNIVYTCAMQDQNLFTANLDFLKNKLQNNSLQEKLSNIYNKIELTYK